MHREKSRALEALLCNSSEARNISEMKILRYEEGKCFCPVTWPVGKGARTSLQILLVSALVPLPLCWAEWVNGLVTE